MSKIRVLRVLEYSGEAAVVIAQLQRSMPDGRHNLMQAHKQGGVVLQIATVGGVQGFEYIDNGKAVPEGASNA